MALQKYLRQTWKNLAPSVMREKLIKWRKEPVVLRIDHPTRLDRARSVGYRAKLGYMLIRVRVPRGGRRRTQIKAGRRSRAMRRRKIVSKSYQTIAEERANRKFVNCEVLNSYFVAKDGLHYWYECVLVDRSHPSIKKDKRINWISTQKGRVFRGLTSSGRKSRGLTKKGKGVEKHRPSQKAHKRKGR